MPKRKIRFLQMPKGSDAIIYACTIILAIFGLVMGVSAGMSSATITLDPLVNVVIKQVAYFVVSYLFMYLAAKLFKFSYIKKFLFILVVGTAIALIIPRFSAPINGAYAWIRVPFLPIEFTIQPAEFAKVVMIVLIAVYLGDLKVKNKKGWDIIEPPAIILAVYLVIIMFVQNDLGTAMVILLVSIVCFLIPSNICFRPIQRFVTMVIPIITAGVVFLASNSGIQWIKKLGIKSYQIARFEMANNPFTDRFNNGYQLVNSLIAFSNGGLFGVGLGKSLQKYGYLPEARTDFILAIVAEELGFLGVMVIFLLYAVLIWRLFYYAFKMKSEKNKIVLIGVATYLFVHFLFNVGGVTALIPLTGVPLLLISSGGSSTMAVMMAIGICQAIIAEYNNEKARVSE